MQRLLRHLECNILHAIPDDPVVGNDGAIYDRGAICQWIQNNYTSPITREPMDDSDLTRAPWISRMHQEAHLVSLHDRAAKSRRVVTAFKALADSCLKSECHLFGSWVYRTVFCVPAIDEFYEQCTDTFAYVDPGHHKKSYARRTFACNDLDVLVPGGVDVETVIEGMRKCLPFVAVRPLSPQPAKKRYWSSAMRDKDVELTTLVVGIPGVSELSTIELKVDLLVGTNATIDVLAQCPYPNLLKRFVRQGFNNFNDFAILGTDLASREQLYDRVLSELVRIDEQGEFITPYVRPGADVFRAKSLDDLVSDIKLYCRRLLKELLKGRAKNLSFERDGTLTRTFSKEGAPHDATVLFNLTDVDDLCMNTPPSLLRKGILVYTRQRKERILAETYDSDDEVLRTASPYIHVCCDPDFSTEDVPEMAKALRRANM